MQMTHFPKAKMEKEAGLFDRLNPLLVNFLYVGYSDNTKDKNYYYGYVRAKNESEASQKVRGIGVGNFRLLEVKQKVKGLEGDKPFNVSTKQQEKIISQVWGSPLESFFPHPGRIGEQTKVTRKTKKDAVPVTDTGPEVGSSETVDDAIMTYINNVTLEDVGVLPRDVQVNLSRLNALDPKVKEQVFGMVLGIIKESLKSSFEKQRPILRFLHSHDPKAFKKAIEGGIDGGIRAFSIAFVNALNTYKQKNVTPVAGDVNASDIDTESPAAPATVGGKTSRKIRKIVLAADTDIPSPTPASAPAPAPAPVSAEAAPAAPAAPAALPKELEAAKAVVIAILTYGNQDFSQAIQEAVEQYVAESTRTYGEESSIEKQTKDLADLADRQEKFLRQKQKRGDNIQTLGPQEAIAAIITKMEYLKKQLPLLVEDYNKAVISAVEGNDIERSFIRFKASAQAIFKVIVNLKGVQAKNLQTITPPPN